MVHSSRLLLFGGPSSEPLWTQKMPWKKDVWQLQYYCYRFLNYNTSNDFSIYVIVCFLCVFWIKNGSAYVLLTFHWLMVCLYVLILVWFANCGGNDQLEAEIPHQPYRSHCENGSYTCNL